MGRRRRKARSKTTGLTAQKATSKGEVVQDVTPSEAQLQGRRLMKRLENCERSIKEGPRTDWTVVLANILDSTRFYVAVESEHRDQPIQITAWCMRGVYELNVRLRYTLESDQNMREWISERATDELELVDAILKIPQADPASPNIQDSVSELRGRQEHLRGAAERLALDLPKRPAGMSDLAKRVGMKNEHEVLFKIASKFTHPTSYAVNIKPGEPGVWLYHRYLRLSLQVLAEDTLRRVQSALKVPESLVESGVEDIVV